MPCLVTVGGFMETKERERLSHTWQKRITLPLLYRVALVQMQATLSLSKVKVYRVRMLPSAVLNPTTRLLIGSGVLVNTQVLLNEIAKFQADDRTFVDSQCGIIEQKHIDRDIGEDYLKSKVGTTGTGTGPANADRALRMLKLARDIPELSLYIEDVSNSVTML